VLNQLSTGTTLPSASSVDVALSFCLSAADNGMSQARPAVSTAHLLLTDALCTKWLIRSEDNKSLVFPLLLYEDDYSLLSSSF
jgi:hypothetical protein